MKFVANSTSDSRYGLYCLDYTVNYTANVVTVTLGLKWLFLFTLPVAIPGSFHMKLCDYAADQMLHFRISYSLNSLWKDMTLLL